MDKDLAAARSKAAAAGGGASAISKQMLEQQQREAQKIQKEEAMEKQILGFMDTEVQKILGNIKMVKPRKFKWALSQIVSRSQGKVGLMKAKAVQDLLAEYVDPSAVRKITIKSTRYSDSDESSD